MRSQPSLVFSDRSEAADIGSQLQRPATDDRWSVASPRIDLLRAHRTPIFLLHNLPNQQQIGRWPTRCMGRYARAPFQFSKFRKQLIIFCHFI